MRVFFLLFILSGCSTLPPVYRPVEVPMPVAVPCHAPAVTAPAAPAVPASADLAAKVRAALIELDLRKAYEARLQAALATCN